jgi:hypothetical protein
MGHPFGIKMSLALALINGINHSIPLLKARRHICLNSGTVTTGTDHTSTGLTKTFVDNTKNWEPGRLVGFSVKIVNPNAEAYTLGSFITDNTSNSITYDFYSGTDTGQYFWMNAGDQYEIHRVIEMMDECGHGKTDLIVTAAQTFKDGVSNGTTTFTSATAHFYQPRFSHTVIGDTGLRIVGTGIPAGTTIVEVVSPTTVIVSQPIPAATGRTFTITPNRTYNSTTGYASYAHSALEPIFGWNNFYTGSNPVKVLRYQGDQNSPVSKDGVDVFGNLNVGITPITGVPSQVSNYYNAARNGVQYNGDYQYPHPLVTGETPVPTPTPRAGITANPSISVG